MNNKETAVDYSGFTVADWAEVVKENNFKNPEKLEKFNNPWQKIGALLKNMFVLDNEKRTEQYTEILAADNEKRRIKEFIIMLFDKVNNINNETRKKVLTMIPLNEDIKQMVMGNYDQSPADMLLVAKIIEEVMPKVA